VSGFNGMMLFAAVEGNGFSQQRWGIGQTQIAHLVVKSGPIRGQLCGAFITRATHESNFSWAPLFFAL